MGTLRNISSSIKLALLIVAIVIVLGVIGKVSGFFERTGFFGKGLTIDPTANVVTRIRKISELASACSYDEAVLSRSKYRIVEIPVYRHSQSGNKIIDRLGLGIEQDGVVTDSIRTARIAVIVKGKVRAGLDLSKVDETCVKISGDTLTLSLPKPEILDVIVNPSDYEIFDRDGKWNDKEIADILSRAKEAIEENALKNGILPKASSASATQLQSILKPLGFTHIEIIEIEN